MKIVSKIKLIPEKHHRIIKKFFMIVYYTLTKLIVILLINYFLNSLKEALWICAMFMLIRGFAQGIHASKNYWCWIFTLLIFIAAPILVKYFDINHYVIIYTYPLIILNYLVFAPNDTKKNPLVNKTKRIILKIIGLLIVIGYYIYSLYFNNIISESMYYASVITLISFHPLTYIILNKPYYNYRKI